MDQVPAVLGSVQIRNKKASLAPKMLHFIEKRRDETLEEQKDRGAKKEETIIQ